ncbi:hypothetical protein [Serinicoccus sp. CNJ-927]|uniref:hypothetical protein n=1 Tax=Serinicoccus sp. CNJ-927 TaxID=1904970 RepID=UPI0009FA8703|nr:hypothetical protein [Serinicoccus sp. CNJ-927]
MTPPLPTAVVTGGAATTPSSAYLDPPTLMLLLGGLAIAVACLVAGLNGRPPGRVTVGLSWLLQAGVVAYCATYAGRQLGGASPVGPSWELWAYLVTILLLPALALVWAQQEPSRWSTFVLAVAAFVVAVMGARSAQIWYGVGMVP